MRTLVIETATAACSVAIIEDGHVIAGAHDVVGRGHAERLVPMIAALPDGGRADRILVDCGPGSFTGVRVGIAAARGLGLGWGVPVAGFSSLMLVAAAALAAIPDLERVAVVLEGGHGEVFVQIFTPSLEAETDLASLTPADALVVIGAIHAVGSGLTRLHPLVEPATAGLPDAADAHLLPDAGTALPPRPIYGRAPDAKPNPSKRNP
ncbi:tRNA threonylcarbamoyladenosine biosynthesis protein TsaB [Sphingomonas sp. Leaf17]|uniref:tRNA (adenosine(37)-N6)-threonylcarbamoyltransferase complex dimerization subunit type 1 TsaB n=1 Tax=Sphingomonas sp. Leaf17 TaxID=1735683 RepID=UPI0006F7F5B5|nr:tRNA (adenosine(37)-N6)-threonylcarbamoyltransferase complex dimerization subunit type 1 TsaB [Sphingomonas sp. Leaf17]KQM67771.1 tRNA threonylcarbamoyladenosine biosynthesis protein TsaB [Sphingomonas sp. Leaf17]